LLEELARESVEYISTRTHAEKPHISVLGADRYTAENVFDRQTQPLYDKKTEDTVFYDEMDPYSGPRIVPHIYGCYAEFESVSDNRQVKFLLSFYIRVAPHKVRGQAISDAEEFRHVVIEVIITNEQKVKLSLSISGAGEEVKKEYEDRLEDIRKSRSKEIIFEVPVRTYSSLLTSQHGPRIILISDDDIIRALTTLKETSYGEFYFSPANKSSREMQLIYSFAIRAGVKPLNTSRVRIYCLLYNVGGFAIDSKGKRIGSYFSCARYMLPGQPNQIEYLIDRWSTEYLLELEGKFEWNGYEKAWDWIREQSARRHQVPGLRGLFPINCLAIEVKEKEVLLKDWHIEKEIVPRIKRYYQKNAEDTINTIASEFGFAEAGNVVARAFKRAFPHVNYLYSYQVDALERALQIMKENVGAGTCLTITARTAGGKTLAFLIPILLYIVEKRLRGVAKGVKALLFYPTKALANDQAEVIVRFLWYINQILTERGIEPLSIGILHGDTRSRNFNEVRHIINESGVGEEALRIKCPICRKRLIVRFEAINGKWVQEKIICESGCLNDTFNSRLMEKLLKITRESIYSDPPEIVVTNPDTLNVRLLYEPSSHSIFGRIVAKCNTCGATYANINKRKCERCDGLLDKIAQSLSYPQIIVIDEAHLIRGVFGSQVSFVLTRMEQAIRAINDLSEDWRPFYILSSATLNNPQNRAKELLGEHKMLGGFHTIDAEYAIEESTGEEAILYTKLHLFVMPKAFAPQATLGRIIEKMLDIYKRRSGVINESLPSVLIFANRIAEVNSIIHLLRDLLIHVEGLEGRIDGHTTDYQRQRAEIEDAFSRGDIKILVATSGLEVGVDFDIIDIGCIYGMPYYMSDYVQRIGRCGRNKNSLIINVFMPDKPIDHFFYRNWRLLCDLKLRDFQMKCEAYTIRRDNEEVIRRSTCRALFDFLATRKYAYRYYEDQILGAFSSRRAMENTEIILQHLFDLQTYNLLLKQIQRLVQSNLNQEELLQEDLGKLILNSEISDELKQYISNALLVDREKLSMAYQEVKQLISKIVLQEILTYRKSGTNIQEVIKKYNEVFLLWDIRTSELQCSYEFKGLEYLGLGSKEEFARERDMSYAFRHCILGQIISYRGFFFSVKKVGSRQWVEPIKDPEKLIWG